MNQAKFLLLPLFLFCFFTSCRQLTDEKYISEGIIEYDISYPETAEDNVMIALMPKTMLLKFKNDKVAFEFTGGMGLFKATFVSDLQNQKLLHLVKILNKKYALTYNAAEIHDIDEMPGININFTGEKKTIAGYETKRSLITFKDDENTSYDIYFTEDINLKTPNWSTPYKEINGVLMEYQLKRYNVVMRFTATSVKKADIDDSDFEKPDDYKIITKEEMDQLFLNLN
ncbi:MAG: hypothetical protein H0V01_12460 [Bacteroidetes bacterium]|nr:hypothetical protein [Bacteroidota bacterium]HET6245873.1 hypothetical protein [Bacteroidia bacterium]